MEKKEFVIIRSNGEDYLCVKQKDIYVYISNPMLNFAEGKDEFEIIPSDPTYLNKVYEYEGEQVHVRLKTYNNGWPAILLVPVESEENYSVISVNLENTDAMGLPNRTFIDVNNESKALKFLLDNKLAADIVCRRNSGSVSYPMVNLNLPLFYQHDPESFQDINF